MLSYYSRYAVVVIALVFSFILYADYWYQRYSPVQVPHTEVNSMMQALCKEHTCKQGMQLANARVMSSDELALTPSILSQLRAGEVIAMTGDHGHYYYSDLPSTPFILRLGPYSIQPKFINSSYTIGFYILMGILILAGFYPLFKEMNKLKGAAEVFTQTGDINSLPTYKGRFFKPVNHAFFNMVNQLARLMALQKELADTVSHEVRTPISRIRFAIETLANSDPKKMVSEIELDLDEMESLVEEYLSFSYLDHEQPHIVTKVHDISFIAEKLASYFQSFTAKKITVDFNHVQKVEACVDEKLFTRALKNLIDNACKYAKNEVNILFEQTPLLLYIHIDDDGAGVTEQKIDSLFLPYTQSQGKNAAGWGLGLAITQKIITLHGGEIIISHATTLGGARFSICLNR